jgi:hypothetical protein
MDNFFDKKLGAPVGEQIPTGGVFVSSGLIAPWRAARVYTFGYQGDIDRATAELAEVGLTIGPNGQLHVRPAGGWSWFTALDRDIAAKAIEALDIRDQRDKLQRPQEEWRFEAADADIVSLNKRGAFGDPAVFSCSVGAHGSRRGTPYKRQHEFHLVALPAAVNAVAQVLGYQTPGFDLSELLSTDYMPTDENQFRLIGGEGHDYKESVLWQQRAALWKALGEDNADVYNPIPVVDGTPHPDLAGTKEYKLNTGSAKLNDCLRLYFNAWLEPIWCRLMLVTDPRVDAYYKRSDDENKRLNIPAITEIFTSEETARATAEAETTSNGETTETGTTATGSGPTVPEDWVGYEEDWKNIVRGIKAEGKPMPIALKNVKPDEISATVDDVRAWWDQV